MVVVYTLQTSDFWSIRLCNFVVVFSVKNSIDSDQLADFGLHYFQKM